MGVNGRKQYIDAAKGIGIILVFISHTCGVPVIGNYAYAYYIPLFFILSGFTYHDKQQSAAVQIKMRAKRLLIPYFSYCALCLGVYSLMDILSHQFTIHKFLLGIAGISYSRAFLYPPEAEHNIYFLVGRRYCAWFLTAMFLAFVVFVLIKKVMPKNFYLKLCVLFGMVALTALVPYLPIALPWCLESCTLSAFFIFCGYYIAQTNFLDVKSKGGLLVRLLICLSVYVVSNTIEPNTSYSVSLFGAHGFISPFLFAIMGISGSFALMLLCRLIENDFLGSLFALVGKHTVIIFCLHLLCYDVLDMLIARLMPALLSMGGVKAYIFELIKIALVIFR